ncbi:ATP-binding protein [Sphaerisporangium corydalis]|uniref:MalT-like TPR region domain-containing protein n=1 Tax=Sphaerisporangium corydalis TaxID=1441875 RepID=A0ABV9EA88_9ACTN|nr:hypothetical protein [Sphaerisporangium corydalis]
MTTGLEADAGQDDIQLSLLAGERALYAQGDLGTGRKWFDVAYREAERRNDAVAMAYAVLGLSGLWVHEHRTAVDTAQVRARQRRALSLIDPRSTLALRLRARLAAEEVFLTGAHEGILSMVAEARSSGDAVALVEILRMAHHCLLGPQHAALRAELAEEMIGEAPRTGRRSDLLMGLMSRTVDLFLRADPQAERALEELRARVDRDENLAVGYVVSGIEAMLGIRTGRLEQAEALATACAERGAAADDPTAKARHIGQIGTIRWYQGRLAEMLPALSEAVNSPLLGARDNSFFAILAAAAAAAGERRLAESMLARLCGSDLAEVPRSSCWLVTMYGVAEAAYSLDDTETSAKVYTLLTPYAHLPMIASVGVTCLGSVHHSLGMAALNCGNADKAVEHLRAAVHDNMALGHWPAVVLSRARLGEALALRDGPADETSRRELGLAAGEALALGMAMPVRKPLPDDGGWITPVVAHRRGGEWQLEMSGRAVRVGDSVGMGHLACLLANPGHEISVIDLAAGLLTVGAAHGDGPDRPPLDERAMTDYKRRLSALQDEIDEREASDDPERASAVRAERDRLVDELAGATGLADRPRPSTVSQERARTSVGKAIRRALDRITKLDPTIGHELQATIETGTHCCYRPR